MGLQLTSLPPHPRLHSRWFCWSAFGALPREGGVPPLRQELNIPRVTFPPSHLSFLFCNRLCCGLSCLVAALVGQSSGGGGRDRRQAGSRQPCGHRTVIRSPKSRWWLLLQAGRPLGYSCLYLTLCVCVTQVGAAPCAPPSTPCYSWLLVLRCRLPSWSWGPQSLAGSPLGPGGWRLFHRLSPEALFC